MPSNKITGANAGGPPQLPTPAPWAARIAQFRRSATNTTSNLTMNTRSVFYSRLVCVLGLSISFLLNAQDITPPALLTSIPADNEQNVPLNAAVSFTFSEPMFTSYSVNWSAEVPTRTNYWTTDERTIIYLFSEPLPANTLVTWELNPVGFGTGFRDLAFNPLPPGLYHGSFTTGTNAASLKIQSAGLTNSNQFQLTVVGTGGREVVIHASTDLTNWIALATNSPAHDPVEFAEQLSPSLPRRFYKASVTSILP